MKPQSNLFRVSEYYNGIKGHQHLYLQAPTTIICITIAQSSRTGWGCLIAEPEGFVEERSGIATSDIRAVLWALRESLTWVAQGQPVIIRTTHRVAFQLGRYQLPRWLNEGYADNKDQDLIAPVIRKLRSIRPKWINAALQPFPEDQRSRQLATEAAQDPYMSFPDEELVHLTSPVQKHEKPHLSEAGPKTGSRTSPLQIPHKENCTPRNPSQNHPPAHEKPEKPPTIKPDPPISAVGKPPVFPDPSQPDSFSGPISQEPPPEPPPVPTSGSFLLPGMAEILLYIDSHRPDPPGGWAVLLLDRKSSQALIKSGGLRHASPQRLLLVACIEGLIALKKPQQNIEIRSRHRTFIQLGENWIHNWARRGWRKRGGKPIQDLDFIRQLFDLISKHKIQWQYIPEDSDEYGIFHTRQIAQEAWDACRNGDKPLTRRIPSYPMDRIL